jgi:hypothetical protein
MSVKYLQKKIDACWKFKKVFIGACVILCWVSKEKHWRIIALENDKEAWRISSRERSKNSEIEEGVCLSKGILRNAGFYTPFIIFTRDNFETLYEMVKRNEVF